MDIIARTALDMIPGNWNEKVIIDLNDGDIYSTVTISEDFRIIKKAKVLVGTVQGI